MEWSIKIDDLALGEIFNAEDGGELIVAIDSAPLENYADFLRQNAAGWTPENLRWALPMISRSAAVNGDENADLIRRVKYLRDLGAKKWLIAQCGQLDLLRGDVCDAEWNLYAMNLFALDFWRAQGISRCALSPEDDAENLRSLLREAGDYLQLIVYQDTPLFIGEPCPRAASFAPAAASANPPEKNNRAARHRCGGCADTTEIFRDARGRQYQLNAKNCRATVIASEPFSLSGQLSSLASFGLRHARIDFAHRAYRAADAREILRRVKNDEILPRTHGGNFERGIR